MTTRRRRTIPGGPLVLIVDDVRPLAEQYAYDLQRLGGFRTRVASGGGEALEILTREVIDCVILDLEMPGLDGFGVLRAVQHREIDVPVIVYTSAGTFDRCVDAVRLGAFSFIDKAESMERVVHEVRLGLRQTDLRQRLVDLEERVAPSSTLIGESEPMQAVRAAIARLADIPSPVLVFGESGTGKELVARELHCHSGRRDEAFVPVNCGGIPEGLVDSRLFGHERGAFTGAVKAHRGAFERATLGTLFLDEIGELPSEVQARLLRVLEYHEVERVGSEEIITVRTRVVTATHRDLDAAVEEGAFRHDLLYRLNVHVIRVPPLRDRPDDVPLLAKHFAKTLPAELGRSPRPLTDAALGALRARTWERNNVRELRNTVERMIIASDEDFIDIKHLPDDLARPSTAPPDDANVPHGTAAPDDAPHLSYHEQKRAAEYDIVVAALEANDWLKVRTARCSNSPTTRA